MSFVMRNKYKFSIHNSASAILGGTYSNQEVIGIGAAEIFYKDASDIYTTHETLKGVIPNLPDIKNCTFYMFKDSFGAIKVFSDEYILTSSIALSSTVNMVITIPNLDSDLPSVVRDEIKRLGINNAVIEFV